MKISIEGFDQSRAVELGLCVADMVLLRWFVDFSNTGAMEKRIIDGIKGFDDIREVTYVDIYRRKGVFLD